MKVGESGPGGDGLPEPVPLPRDLTELAVSGLLQRSEPGPNVEAGDAEDVNAAPKLPGDDVLLSHQSMWILRSMHWTRLLHHLPTKFRNLIRAISLVTLCGRCLSKCRLPSGADIDEEIQTDVLNLISRMVDESKYGGLVAAHGDDIVAMVRNFQESA